MSETVTTNRASSNANPSDSALPEVLQRGRVAHFRRELSNEFNPVGFSERQIVDDLAHRAANMALLARTSDALQRKGARSLLDVTLPLQADGQGVDEDDLLSSAMASGRIDECQRQSLGNSRAFYRALGVLQNIQAKRRNEAIAGYSPVDPRFSTEPDCVAYMLRPFECGERCCTRCQGMSGSWIASRRCWECSDCGRQTGLRVGTVMERSSLPLVKWFAAIRMILLQRNTSTDHMS